MKKGFSRGARLVNTVRRAGLSLLVAALVLSLIPALAGAAVQDVVGTRFEAAVNYLKNFKVLEGRPDGFYPLEPITRAEATKIIVLITGKGDLAPLLKGAPSFPDVTTSHWASGYIAVAKNLGIVNGFPDGTFRPESLVTYAEYAKMLVEAAGLAPTAGLAWPANYVDAASKAGVLEDVGFQANSPAIRGDCAIMSATTVKDVPDPTTGKTLGQTVFGESSVASIEMTPSTQTVGVGVSVYFTVVARDEDGAVVEDFLVTYSTNNPSKSTVSSTGRFSATQAGVYAVTAQVGDLSATSTVNVFGTPVALEATASPTSVVANGVSTSTIKVDIVDASGTRVPAADNEVTIAYADDNGAVELPEETKVKAVNGVATFVVTARTVDDVTDKLKFTATGLTADTISIKAVEQDPSSFKLTAEPAQLPVNESFDALVSAQVLDQAGEPMLYGTYYVTFSISGDGLLDGDDEPVTEATVDQIAYVTVSSIRNDPGTIKITAKASGVSTKSITIPTYLAGVPKSIKVTAIDTEGEPGGDAGADDMRIIVGLYDSKGRPALADEEITVEFVTPDGSELDGLDPVTFSVGDSYETVWFQGNKAGTFKVTVRDENTADPEVSSTSFYCTVTASTVNAIAISPSGDPVIYLPIDYPRVTLTAQLQDGLGNDVAKSGVKLQFSATVAGSGTPSWSASKGRVTTDSTGKATITMIGDGYNNNRYTVYVDADLDNDGAYDDESGSTEEHGIRVSDSAPDSMHVAFKSPAGTTISYVEAEAGEEARCHITVRDDNGYAVEIEDLDVEVTFSNSGRNVLAGSVTVIEGDDGPPTEEAHVYRFKTNADGQVIFGFEGGLAGSFNVTAKCLNATKTVSKTAGFRTTAGTTVVDALILKTDNTPADDLTIRANRAIQLRVALVDHGGNPVGAPDDTRITFEPSRPTGEYRASSSGTEITHVDLSEGTAYKTIYYIDTEADSGVDLSGDVTGYGPTP